MAKDKIYIQDNNEVIELIGQAKDDFIAQQKQNEQDVKTRFDEIKVLRELKISAYTKLGLTEEEINAIL